MNSLNPVLDWIDFISHDGQDFQPQRLRKKMTITVMPEPEGQLAPQYLADQLIHPGRADYPHLLLLAPPMFFTFQHH